MKMAKAAKQRMNYAFGKNFYKFELHSYILQLNIPLLSEMNAESTAVLQVMISETKHEIHGGSGNHHPLGSRCHKKTSVA